MVYASQLFVSFLMATGAVFASPVLDNELEGRASPRCKVHAEGYLATALLKNSKGTLTCLSLHSILVAIIRRLNQHVFRIFSP